MAWEPELAELAERQHGRGKMDARGRIAGIVDEGSFREIGKMSGRVTSDGEMSVAIYGDE